MNAGSARKERIFNMKKKFKIMTADGKKITLKAQLWLYYERTPDGKYAPCIGISLYKKTCTGFDFLPSWIPYSELTRLFGGSVLEKNSAYVDINECPIIKQLLDMGIAEETEKYKVGALGRYPMWRFTEKFLKACDRRIYREYIKGFNKPLATAPY